MSKEALKHEARNEAISDQLSDSGELDSTELVEVPSGLTSANSVELSRRVEESRVGVSEETPSQKVEGLKVLSSCL